MQTAEALNQQFGIDGVLCFEQNANGMVIAEVSNAQARARVTLQGAQVIGFQPEGEEPVIWLSEDAKLTPGKSIRGGAPICWPWFGAHPESSALPSHGFARTVEWRLVQAHALPDGRTQLVFDLEDKPNIRWQWPHASRARNVITIGRELDIELLTTNIDTTPFVLGEALHTYFQVGDVRRVTIHGLEGGEYLDKVDDFARKQQRDAITIEGEVDRIYLNTARSCEIRDPALQRRIRITSSGSHSTVVWNPGPEKAAKMGDMGSDGYLHMLCVETANAAEDVVTVEPGAQYRLYANYRVEAL